MCNKVAPDRAAAEETLRRLEERGDDATVWFISDSLRYPMGSHLSNILLA